jgi:formamidopyrimidine-DNA glycosylase
MPEVCEVCLTSQYLSSAIGDKITGIKILRGRYLKKPIKGLEDLQFPLQIEDIDTKGKFMWMTLKHDDKIFYMLNTYGLTGTWAFDKIDASNIRFSVKSKNSKYKMYFGDVRNFGTIEFTDDIKVLNKKLNKLAPDFLKTPLSLEEFQNKFQDFKNKKKKIVVVLMSQESKDGIGSGLGNYLVPEILYRAKLSPHRTIGSLEKDDLKKLYKSINYTLRLCYISNITEYVEHLEKFLETHSKNIKDGKFPNYLGNVKTNNETFQFQVYRRKEDDAGNEVIGDKIISGRTTYWCPTVQK